MQMHPRAEGFESLPEALQQRMEAEDLGYDDDDDADGDDVDFTQRPNRPQIDMDIITVEGNVDKPTSSQSFRLDYQSTHAHKEGVPSKVLTVGGHNNGDMEPGSGHFASDDEDDGFNDDGDDFAIPKRGSNYYFRKNANDAIKIISTPLGKVGIVYQQPMGEHDNNNKGKSELPEKKSTLSFTDFDALSPDPESSRKLASSNPKITPVLTPDGKVALLYRGDSENSKYEPIRNVTHKLTGSRLADAIDNKNEAKRLDVNVDSVAFGVDSDMNSSNYSSNLNDAATVAAAAAAKNDQQPRPVLDSEEDFETSTPVSSSHLVRQTDSVLPMINRPLSEVLGIKKNQFKQFRVKDYTTPAGFPMEGGGAHVGVLHSSTKVNLADFAGTTRLRDFDFSRDSTMLDERTRPRVPGSSQKTDADGVQKMSEGTLNNEEMLSKTEVINLAILPNFDEEVERLQRLNEQQNRRFYRARPKQTQQSEEELSGIHCIMQIMMGIAAISTVFGMIGTFFKQRILDQLRLLH